MALSLHTDIGNLVSDTSQYVNQCGYTSLFNSCSFTREIALSCQAWLNTNAYRVCYEVIICVDFTIIWRYVAICSKCVKINFTLNYCVNVHNCSNPFHLGTSLYILEKCFSYLYYIGQALGQDPLHNSSLHSLRLGHYSPGPLGF